mmetsp:Transcript_8724/g.21280  ORF Transcript_8724/g.21280 Transcript_8724/m.21280 type:complete len:303 (-) Transcript_8724:414-1322(-)
MYLGRCDHRPDDNGILFNRCFVVAIYGGFGLPHLTAIAIGMKPVHDTDRHAIVKTATDPSAVRRTIGIRCRFSPCWWCLSRRYHSGCSLVHRSDAARCLDPSSYGAIIDVIVQLVVSDGAIVEIEVEVEALKQVDADRALAVGHTGAIFLILILIAFKPRGCKPTECVIPGNCDRAIGPFLSASKRNEILIVVGLALVIGDDIAMLTMMEHGPVLLVRLCCTIHGSLISVVQSLATTTGSGHRGIGIAVEVRRRSIIANYIIGGIDVGGFAIIFVSAIPNAMNPKVGVCVDRTRNETIGIAA